MILEWIYRHHNSLSKPLLMLYFLPSASGVVAIAVHFHEQFS